MILNITNAGEYRPDYVNIGLSDLPKRSDISPDIWLTKDELLNLNFPKNVIGIVRLNRVLQYFDVGELCSLFYILRSFTAEGEEESYLSIDGYGTSRDPDKYLKYVLLSCGYLGAELNVRGEQYKSEFSAVSVSEEKLDSQIVDRVLLLFQNLSNNNFSKYCKWKTMFYRFVREKATQAMRSDGNIGDNKKQDRQSEILTKKIKTQVLVRVVGGLGDQFTRYATARLIAIKNGAEVKFDDYNMRIHKYNGRSCVLQHFNTKGNFASKQDFADLITAQLAADNKAGLAEKYLSPFITDDKHIPDCGRRYNGVTYVVNEGTWQYFKEIVPILKQEFTLREKLLGENAEMAARIVRCQAAISVHVRLTDFLTLGLELSPNYYKKAMSVLESKVSNPHYFVFSDDIEKARQFFSAQQNITFVDINDAKHGYRDFALMTLCCHHITCKSSFSWWAALLRNHENGVICVPADYLRERPEGWIAIDDYQG